MRKHSWRWAVGCLFVACATPSTPPPGPEIKSIRIEGAKAVSPSDIKKKILTSESDWWIFGRTSYFDPTTWEGDLRRIQRYYEARGYYQAQLVNSQIIPEGDDAVQLRVTVKEGPPTLVAAVEIHGLEGLPPDQQAMALKDLTLSPGEVFEEADWKDVKSQVAANLREQGYVEAAVSGEVQVDLATHKATAVLNVQPGQRYRIGDISVTVDQVFSREPQVDPRRILEQAKGAVHPGKWYSDSALAEAQTRVFKMGVFGAVKVNRGTPDRSAGTVPIIVDVREAPFHTLKVGGGAGLDPTRYEGRLIAEYTDRNFLGDLRRLTLRGKIGYAWLIVPGPESSGPIFDALAELQQPHFFFRDLRFQGSLSGERNLDPAFSDIGGKLKLGVVWQPHPAVSFYPSYNFEAYSLVFTGDPSGTTPVAVLGCATQGIKPNAPCYLPISYLEQFIEWDRRNDKSEPRRGYYLAVSLQEGGGILGGASRFFRVVPEGRFYHTVSDRLTVAARARAGTLIASDGNGPIVSRFFSGGPQMRGFGDRRLAPYLLGQAPNGDAVSVPVGGNGLFEFSIEARYQLTNNLLLALFVDTGFVTKEKLSVSSFDNLQTAVGAGLRYLTLVGPIRIDLAYRLPVGRPLENWNPNGPTEVIPHNTCFFFGPVGRNSSGHPELASGYPEGACAFHLSIGEAF